jgi:hypothetical protein
MEVQEVVDIITSMPFIEYRMEVSHIIVGNLKTDKRKIMFLIRHKNGKTLAICLHEDELDGSLIEKDVNYIKFIPDSTPNYYGTRFDSLRSVLEIMKEFFKEG